MKEMEIEEGQVKLLIPTFEKVSARAPVFYNPVMELNRDISVLALQQFQKDRDSTIKVCDAFGGSGIRGIRYSQEVYGVSEVVVNDISSLALDFAEKNGQLNGVENMELSHDDANLVMRNNRGKFDVIDIDPFGTPSYFIESAANSLKSNSMLCVTATDTSALCGTYKEPCIRKYNSLPLKTEYCHENGIRILISFVARAFAKYKKRVDVKLSHSSEHYMRIYFKIDKGAAKTDKSLENLGFIIHCRKCLFRDSVPGIAPGLLEKCPLCGEKLLRGGPMWLGKVQDYSFINSMLEMISEKSLNREKEVIKLLSLCKEEYDAPPGFYDLHVITKKLKISSPPLMDVLNGLKNEGYSAHRTHYRPTGIKTDAPLDEIEKVVLSRNNRQIVD
ncbi:MAG: tRNA (guanine(26)-N(2))-dimethyltransferase [Euryarchaeota archaeon]|nr:tRNA (guanine(26)-N(2))-dimethyltransferase [Euryarchaeota archaeon]MBU4607091.1 tRNA (guanine(26)-N(2))-dimethyltransferase [Euryarchaeota archaeon]MBV1730537.1 tRNA (guanine(26)-N(2))-dimethyltransferase [Methanobacterium sp.]MBV1755520.1 tRNA (guanine(26)-N(2))-dimethyltransferase [Methanobacterium sp.]